MLTYLPLGFVQEKVSELQSALFFPTNKAVLKIPTHIVTIMDIDELGQIWFLIPKPMQSIHEFDKEFPAKLDFFRKGKPFYLKIQGKGFIITDPEEINSISCVDESTKCSVRNSELVLIKVKIQFADYVESVRTEGSNWIAKTKTHLYKWFYSQQNARVPSHPDMISLRGMIHLPNILTN